MDMHTEYLVASWTPAMRTLMSCFCSDVISQAGEGNPDEAKEVEVPPTDDDRETFERLGGEFSS